MRLQPRFCPGGGALLLELQVEENRREGDCPLRATSDWVTGPVHGLRWSARRIRLSLPLVPGVASRVELGSGPSGAPRALEVLWLPDVPR